MKHFLKPLGHCLTTAVMTSAMLRVYTIPPAEAATPDVEPQPSSDTVTAEGAASLVSPSLSVSAPAAPEVIDYVESAPAPPIEASVAPTVSPAPAPTVEPESEHSNQLVEPPAGEPTKQPASSHLVAVPEEANPKPDATSAQPSVKPAADSVPVGSETEINTEEAPPSTQKADAPTTRTIAGMRQIVEKRLETIVGQDKERRDAKWQQNIIRVALEYAWQGKFDAARKVAASAALPLELQMSLLGKIAAIETEFLAAQVAQSSGAAGQKPQAKQAGQASTPPGRNLPSGYTTVSGWPSLPGYAGVSLESQCPLLESSPSRSVSPPQTSRSTAASKGKTGVPDFVPALGQNLASRLARLSQTQSAPPPANSAAKPVVLSGSQFVAPQLFTGVVSSSVQAQPKQHTQPKVAQPQATQPTPLLTETQSNKPEIGEHQFAEQLFPTQLAAPAPLAQSTSAAQDLMPLAVGRPVDQAEIKDAKVKDGKVKDLSLRQATLPLSDALQPFGFAFPELFDNPLDWVWNWWDIPTPQTQAEQFAVTLPADAEASVSTVAQPLVAEVGLGNRPLLQTLEQDLTLALQPLRNARKFPLALPLSKTMTLKAPSKAAVYDPSALLAMSCNRAKLAQSDSGYTLISPATAKQFGWVNLMFPLPIPAVITSAFGWRTHPISGDLRFHTGLDIGAPMGTPVLSAVRGRVVVADTMGGYGLAVVVEDETTHQRNLYAHLSGIAVQPGATVEQGTVLGWVGSTGNSTGPHLHFEAQVKTENGWTVIDPLASAAVTVAKGE